MIMKNVLYFLIISFCFICCQRTSTKEYVIDRINNDLTKAVRLIHITETGNSLDLRKYHPIDYFRTLTPPDDCGDIHECVAVRFQEGILYSVNGSLAVYFFDNNKLTKNHGIISAVHTKDNYWLPAIITSDGMSAGYECIANGTNYQYHIVGLEQQRKKLIEMKVSFDPYALPLVEPIK